MPLLTIVEEYIVGAMKRATAEPLKDGTLAAHIPEFPGVVAFGADAHECAKNLYAHLEEWVQRSLERRYELPVVDGIDLNTQAGRILATYHRSRGQSPSGSQHFESEEDLDEAFAARGEVL